MSITNNHCSLTLISLLPLIANVNSQFLITPPIRPQYFTLVCKLACPITPVQPLQVALLRLPSLTVMDQSACADGYHQSDIEEHDHTDQTQSGVGEHLVALGIDIVGGGQG